MTQPYGADTFSVKGVGHCEGDRRVAGTGSDDDGRPDHLSWAPLKRQ